MAKTRGQTGNRAIKKEEEQEDCKDNLLLNGVSKPNKISKPKPSKNKNRCLPDQQVKVEEDPDTKSLLISSSKCTAAPRISQEQINGLIDYVVNHKKSMIEASRKVNVSTSSGYKYYSLYKNDPDRKIPLLGNQRIQHERVFMQEDIDNLIKYIVDDKMSVPKASTKANMSCKSGSKYYSRYLQDPNHAIPIPSFRQYYTQDQKNKLIGYIVNDKMTMSAASRKANMNPTTANKYYHQYLKDNSMEIPVSKYRKRYTQDEKNKVVGYIVHDKMSINAASKKANMDYSTGGKYYRQYLKGSQY